jgi:hypothetical protein
VPRATAAPTVAPEVATEAHCLVCVRALLLFCDDGGCSSSQGRRDHVAGELLMAGVNLVHVPYRGIGPALTDLLDGGVMVAIDASAVHDGAPRPADVA